MNTTDPIADLITRIRNASRAGKTMTRAPHSIIKESICSVLKKHNYIEDFSVTGTGIEKELAIELKDGLRDLHIKRISKPGQRIYVGVKEIPRVLDGLGIAILSTPKGLMDGVQARKMKVGGEYLCEVY